MEDQEFMREVAPVRDLWRWIDLRVIALREPDLGWRCDRLRAILAYEEPELITNLPDLPDGLGMLATHAKWPVGRLEDLAAGLQAGEVDIDGTTLHVKGEAGTAIWRPLSPYVRAYDREESRAGFGVDFATLVLHAWGNVGRDQRRTRLQETLDARLRAAPDRPWDGIADLRRSFIGQTADESQRHEALSADIVAPLLVRLCEDTAVRGTDLNVAVEGAPSADLSGIRVAVFVKVADRVAERTYVPLEAREATVTAFSSRGHLKLAVPFSGVSCALTFRGVDADSKVLLGPGAGPEHLRWSLFRALVGGPESLRDVLGALPGGDPFEHAVATLFHLLGFAVHHFGRNTFGTDLPDMLAVAPGDLAYVIECTSRAVDAGGEIAKLATRTREMRQAVPGRDLRPVFVTGQPRTAIPDAAKEDAAKEHMVIIASEDLQALIELSVENPNTRTVADHLGRLIPSTYGM